MARWFIILGGSVVALYGALAIYLKIKKGRYKIAHDLSEKIILITGATSGIGLATARELAGHGASVHLLCRNERKAVRVAEEIKSQTQNSKVHTWKLDTSSLSSVRAFATKFLATKERIDALINNAGTYVEDRTLTEDGFEMTMASNHLGHFLLTNLFLDRIKETKNARIINVSSIAHRYHPMFNIDDMNMETVPYDGLRAYGNSKMANILFTRELAVRLADTGITANCLCPGPVVTAIFDKLNTLSPIRLFNLFLFPIFKSAKDGAATTLYLIDSDDVKEISGEFFEDCKLSKAKAEAYDETLAKKLWTVSEEFTGVGEK